MFVVERTWTPETHANREIQNERDLLVVYLHDAENMTFTAIAKRLRRSNTRIAGIYHRAKRARNLGEL